MADSPRLVVGSTSTQAVGATVRSAHERLPLVERRLAGRERMGVRKAVDAEATIGGHGPRPPVRVVTLALRLNREPDPDTLGPQP